MNTTPDTAQAAPVHPLLMAGVPEALTHLVGGRQLRETLPDVKAAYDAIDFDRTQDIVDAMEDTQS